MSTLRVNRRLPIALGVTLLVLVALMALSALSYFRRVGAEQWKTHTYRVLLETNKLRSELLDAQTSARGYALTGDSPMLKSYEQTRARFDNRFKIARELTSDNPVQQQRLAKIEKLHLKWRALTDDFFREKKARSVLFTQTEVASRIRRNASVMREVRAVLNAMENEEEGLLVQRTKREESEQARSAVTLFSGGLFCLFILTYLSLALTRNARELARAGVELQCENRERENAEAWVREANKELQEQIGMLEQRNGEIELLSQSGELLQACHNLDEARRVITKIAPRLFPNDCGGVYLFNPSGNLLEAAARWNPSHDERCANEEYFAPDMCWALRRGTVHFFENGAAGTSDMACRHLSEPLPNSSLCLPMTAQGNVLGLLNLSQVEAPLDAGKRRLALAFFEQIALATANLQLRETLRHQSIRDPLTNLYNRRYLEESLERELARAARDEDSVGVIMIDLDHFKKFNDTYYHDAGDAMLRAMANFLNESIRGGDIACRYGGEELTLILPEASLKGTCRRAEKICEGAAQMQITHRGQKLGPVTLSLGIAAFPHHGSTPAALLKAADSALYQAKSLGRNRVVCLPAAGESTLKAMTLAANQTENEAPSLP